jgi:hypothetical protein
MRAAADSKSRNERQIGAFMLALSDCRVQLMEQPRPAGADDARARTLGG